MTNRRAYSNLHTITSAETDVHCIIWTSGYLTGGISGCLPIVYIARYTICVVKCLLSFNDNCISCACSLACMCKLDKWFGIWMVL